MRPINKIIIHHTATKREDQYDVEWCNRLHKSFGWKMIGYHFFIEHDGKLSAGRPLGMTGAHSKGNNYDSIGVAFVGGRDARNKEACTITEAQWLTLQKICNAFRVLYGDNIPIHGHRMYKNTFCPGFDAEKIDWDGTWEDAEKVIYPKG